MRAIISDFAVFITILTMVLVDYALGIPSPKLQVPNKFKVSAPEQIHIWLYIAFMLLVYISKKIGDNKKYTGIQQSSVNNNRLNKKTRKRRAK